MEDRRRTGHGRAQGGRKQERSLVRKQFYLANDFHPVFLETKGNPTKTLSPVKKLQRRIFSAYARLATYQAPLRLMHEKRRYPCQILFILHIQNIRALCYLIYVVEIERFGRLYFVRSPHDRSSGTSIIRQYSLDATPLSSTEKRNVPGVAADLTR